jgi:hypothetical protein
LLFSFPHSTSHRHILFFCVNIHKICLLLSIPTMFLCWEFYLLLLQLLQYTANQATNRSTAPVQSNQFLNYVRPNYYSLLRYNAKFYV